LPRALALSLHDALPICLAAEDVAKIGYYRFARGVVAGIDALISRTGYTGEDGFELYAQAVATARLWAALLEAGRDDGAQPIGLRSEEHTSELQSRSELV